MRNAFTLIELLIVVAIIGILAAIAIPNFLEAQTRARISRSRSDLRTFAMALESYRVDVDDYPPHGELLASGIVNMPAVAAGLGTVEFLPPVFLTTPLAYLNSVQPDPFLIEKTNYAAGGYGYIHSRRMANILRGKGASFLASANAIEPTYGLWRLYAAGPDRDKGDAKLNIIYDPTNGTLSDGDLLRTQRDPEFKAPQDEH